MPQGRVSFPRSSPRLSALRALFSLVLLLSQILPSIEATAYTRSQSGRWTPRQNWGAPAVHLVLLRSGDSPYHSKVLWWLGLGHHELFFGGVWGWSASSNYDCAAYPGTNVLSALAFSGTNAGSPFCAGHSQLADGTLLLAGGTQPGSEFGIRHTVTFDAAATPSSAWQVRDSMELHRWYPSVTTLSTGVSALTLSGSHHQHLQFWGGLKNGEGTPSDTAVFRYGIGAGGYSDTPVRAFGSSLWPKPREGHSGAYQERGGGYTSVFGGRLADGTYSDELWELRRQQNPTGADYTYVWGVAPVPISPPKRWRHVAVSLASDSASLLVLGGVRKNALGQDECLDDVWRYRSLAGIPRWVEVNVTNPTSSSAPGARADHATLWHEPSRSMLVFGGRSTPGGSPTDSALYRLTFTSDMTQATWSKLSATGPRPRAGTALAYTPAWTHDSHTHAFLFGGEHAGGKLNDLWDLKLDASLSTVEWINRTTTDPLGGSPPSPRSGHTMIADGGNHWLYVFGGTSPVSSADDTVYKAHLGGHNVVTEESRAWEPYARHSAGALSGHIAVFEKGAIFARKPEIYSATGDEWSTLNTSLLQEWYPQAFVMKPDTVFVAGPDVVGRKLALSTGAWSVFPEENTTGFKGGASVMYRPGKVMKAGSRDTDGDNSNATGTTRSVNLNAGFDAHWRASSNSMAPRVNHNLVLLPNGDVLVVGGTRVINNQSNTALEPRPELWFPDSVGGAGQWRGIDTLEAQPTMRDYHSTALLLPDGRVLCAGGNAGTGRDSAEIFCPPYLFNGDDLATRPTLVSATGRWRYNSDVTFSVSGDTTIRRACLMHPGSTTHGQDMAQSYIPLSLLTSSERPDGVRQYFLKAPPDSFAAPPGDYMLFASNAAGVPSIALWVRVGSNLDRQYDGGAPDELTFSTTFIYCDEISPIYWTAPGDDGNVGTALDYDIRYSWSPITTQNFNQATPMTSAGMPLLAGTVQTGDGFEGLSPATMLYVAGRTMDKAGNLSPTTFAEFGTLSSCGGGGYGTSARRSREEAGTSTGPNRTGGGSSAMRAFSIPAAQLAGGETKRLVGEFEETRGTARWRLVVTDFSGDTELLEASAREALIQTGGESQGWSTRITRTLQPGEVGVRTLPTAGRVVFPAGACIQSFDLAPRGYECTEAFHSRLGDLNSEADSMLANEFTASDTLSLAFLPAATSGTGSSLFRVVIPGEARATAARRPGSTPPREVSPSDIPTRFALHPTRPNPFSTATSIRFDLPTGERVRLELFDVLGRRVATVLDKDCEPGRHLAEWRGLTETGARAPAGVYLCRIIAGTFVAERRVSLRP